MSRAHALAWPWRSLGIAAAACAATAVPAIGARLALVDGGSSLAEPWRLWTGHLVHGSTYHLAWDALACLAMGVLFERAIGRRVWLLLGTSAPIVGLGTLAAHPELASYGGLSGVLNALFVAGAWTLAHQEAAARRTTTAWLFRLCVVGIAAKIVVELALGTPLLVDAAALGGTPVPIAHALGAACGAGFVLVVEAAR